MLLESSQWYSPARRLKWGGRPLYSERITEKEYCTDKNMLSKPFVETLNVKDTPSNRYLFRLVPLEHRTEGTEFGLIARLVTHPNRDRCRNWTNEQKLISECERKDDYCNGCKDGITTYSDGDRHKAREEGERAESCGREYFPQSEKWRDAPERFYGLDGFSRIAADPYGKRQIYGNDQRTERWSEPDEQFKTQYSSSIWEKFPTQSPICSGDDGLSGRLDGITFSKWRQESVKAYGNAIVPQVAYEIFKAIELCR